MLFYLFEIGADASQRRGCTFPTLGDVGVTCFQRSKTSGYMFPTLGSVGSYLDAAKIQRIIEKMKYLEKKMTNPVLFY